jgi:hypothetical protein
MKKDYYAEVLRYCNDTGLSPDELIHELPRKIRTRKHVLEFHNWLDDTGLSINSKKKRH